MVALVVAAIYIGHGFERLELISQDARFLLRGLTTATSEVVVVGITQQCIDDIGAPPWRRSLYAKAIEQLNAAGAGLICLDIIFPHPSDPEEDARLAEAVQKAGNVILPVFSPVALRHYAKEPTRQIKSLRGNFPALSQAAAGLAHINIPPSADGKCRSIPLAISHEGKVYYNLGIEAAQRFLDRQGRAIPAQPPLTPEGDLLINYGGQHTTFDFLPFHKILTGDFPQNQLKDKLVLLGQTSLGQVNADLVSTPLGVMYGVLVQGVLMDNVLTGHFLQGQSLGGVLATILILSLGSGLAFGRLSPLRSLLAWLAASLVLIGCSFLFFTMGGYLLETTPALTVLAANFTIALIASLRLSQAAIRQNELEFQTLHRSSRFSARELSLDNAPKTFLKLISRTVKANLTTLTLFDRPDQWFCTENADMPRAASLTPDAAKAFEQEAVAVLNQSTSSFLSNDLARDPVFGRFSGPAGTFLSVPLIVRDQTIGRLNCYNGKRPCLTPPAGFQKRDAKLVAVLAQQTALLLDNTRLIDRLKGQNQQLQATMDTLQATQNELIQKEKLSAIGEMASMIIHDMRSPLTAVLGYAGMIGEMDLSKAELQEFTATIADQVNRINQMAQQILDFSRGNGRLNLALVSTDVLLGDLMRQLQTEFRQQETLEFSCEISCHQPLEVDREKMLRALLNLARNAAEAMEAKGRVAVSCRPGRTGVELAVSDTGAGIPEEISSRLFQPFATYGKAKGTGLGLAIVKKTVRDHGGDIRVESEAGRGATFIISLPAAACGDLHPAIQA